MKSFLVVFLIKSIFLSFLLYLTNILTSFAITLDRLQLTEFKKLMMAWQKTQRLQCRITERLDFQGELVFIEGDTIRSGELHCNHATRGVNQTRGTVLAGQGLLKTKQFMNYNNYFKLK